MKRFPMLLTAIMAYCAFSSSTSAQETEPVVKVVFADGYKNRKVDEVFTVFAKVKNLSSKATWADVTLRFPNGTAGICDDGPATQRVHILEGKEVEVRWQVRRLLAAEGKVTITAVPIKLKDSNDKPTEQAKLQGKWKVWFERNDYVIFEVKGSSFSMTRQTLAGQGPTTRGTFTIDEKQNPKQMTWEYEQGGVNRCIYELHNDTWIIIGGRNNRPEHFYSGDGMPHKAWIFKRVSSEK